jgi:DNA polymerase delta subunit 1
VFTLKKCAPIVGSKVYSYEREQEMLEKWRDFFLAVDPDIITGYNIVNFDLPYVMDRAQCLHLSNFAKFSKLKNSLSKIKQSTLSSKALGTRDTKDINIEGRI